MSANEKLNSIKKLSDDALEEVTGGTGALNSTQIRTAQLNGSTTGTGIHKAINNGATNATLRLLNNGNNNGILNNGNNTDNGNNTANIKSTSVTSVGANSIQYG